MMSFSRARSHTATYRSNRHERSLRRLLPGSALLNGNLDLFGEEETLLGPPGGRSIVRTRLSKNLIIMSIRGATRLYPSPQQ
jgi:hypothetical protein